MQLIPTSIVGFAGPETYYSYTINSVYAGFYFRYGFYSTFSLGLFSASPNNSLFSYTKTFKGIAKVLI